MYQYMYMHVENNTNSWVKFAGVSCYITVANQDDEQNHYIPALLYCKQRQETHSRKRTAPRCGPSSLLCWRKQDKWNDKEMRADSVSLTPNRSGHIQSYS